MPNLGHLPVFSAYPDRKFLFCPIAFPYFSKTLSPIFSHNLVTWDRKTLWFDWPQRHAMEVWLTRKGTVFSKPQLIPGFFGVGLAAPADVMAKGEVVGRDVLAGGPWNTYCILEFSAPPGVGTRGCPWYSAVAGQSGGFRILDALETPPYSTQHEQRVLHTIQQMIARPPALETMAAIPTVQDIRTGYQLSERTDLSNFDPKTSK
jgi:hypothetical protein